MILPSYVLKALNLLEQSGFIAVVVGGAVRDFLLGKEPYDYDISTSATPDEIMTVFTHYYLLDFGKKHGTITVFLDHHQLEITTFRVESGYEDFRHPNKTQFVRNLKQDINRRDFTINAICFNKDYIDFVGGMQDLKLGIIRAIGNPQDRFYEDPLRIMRGLRFASTFGFIMEEETKQAIIKYMPLISRVSKERIRDEFNRFLSGEKCVSVFLEYGEKLMAIISPTIVFDYEAIIKRLEVVKGLHVKIASIFLDLAKDQIKKELKSLKYSNNDIKIILMFCDAKNISWSTDRYFLSQLLSKFAYQDVLTMLAFYQSITDHNLTKEQEQIILNNLNDLNLNNHCFHLADLAIDGNQLLQLGIPQGKKINVILYKLLDEIMQGKLANDEQTLLQRALVIYQERR
ncbi:MAG: CCA tRNA nucleotidyltransferase [Bacilli bacterium]